MIHDLSLELFLVIINIYYHVAYHCVIHVLSVIIVSNYMIMREDND